MKNILLFCFTLLCTLGVQAGDLIDLILIPPGKITNKVKLDIRGGIVNKSSVEQTYQVSLYWGKEKASALLCDTMLNIAAGKSDVVKVVIPTADKVGKHKVILKVTESGNVYRKVNQSKLFSRTFVPYSKYLGHGRVFIIGVKLKESIGIRILRR